MSFAIVTAHIPRVISHKLFFAIIGMTLCGSVSSGVLAGVNDTWDGGGTNSNWSTGNNWVDNTAPGNGTTLSFPSGASRLNNTNDIVALSVPTLVFGGTNYILNGNAVAGLSTLQANQASGSNQINFDIDLTANSEFSVANESASLLIGGNIDNAGFDLTLSGDGNLRISGDLSGSGDLIKTSAGDLTLSGNNTGLSGPVTVNAGGLIFDNSVGSATGSGPLTFNNISEFLGRGNTDAPLTVNAGAQVRPGDSTPGILGVGNASFQSGSVFAVQINGPVVGTEYSRLVVDGTLNLDDAIFRIALGTQVGAGNSFLVVQNDASDAVVGEFQGLGEGQTFRLNGVDNVGFKISYQGGDGNDVVLQSIPTISISDATLPQPSSGTSVMTFAVTLSEASDEPITVDFSTADGTALAPDDYLASQGTLSFGPGLTSQNVSITLNSGTDISQNETFTVVLSNPSNASIADAQATGTITPASGSSGTSSGGCGLTHGTPPSAYAWLVTCFATTLLGLMLKILIGALVSREPVRSAVERAR